MKFIFNYLALFLIAWTCFAANKVKVIYEVQEELEDNTKKTYEVLIVEQDGYGVNGYLQGEVSGLTDQEKLAIEMQAIRAYKNQNVVVKKPMKLLEAKPSAKTPK
jgi:hypothetical protein